MKRLISAIVSLAVLIFVCTSGLIEPITKVFVWLITLNYNSPDISVFGQLVAKYGTWIVSYTLVGILFEKLDWFNSPAMKIIYFVVSTTISFLLSWLIMALEKYLLIVSIIVGVSLLLIIIAFIIIYVFKNKKNLKNNEEVSNNA